MQIFSFLEEQSIVCFSGKINIIKINDKSSIGVFYFQDGKLVNARFLDFWGLKAFLELIDHIEKLSDFDYILEPEIIGPEMVKIIRPINKLKDLVAESKTLKKDLDNQRPPDNIKLMIRPEVFDSEEEFSPLEFKLLCTLSDYTLVKDIYRQNDMLEHEITKCLISLRKKNAVKVVEKK